MHISVKIQLTLKSVIRYLSYQAPGVDFVAICDALKISTMKQKLLYVIVFIVTHPMKRVLRNMKDSF